MDPNLWPYMSPYMVLLHYPRPRFRLDSAPAVFRVHKTIPHNSECLQMKYNLFHNDSYFQIMINFWGVR